MRKNIKMTARRRPFPSIRQDVWLATFRKGRAFAFIGWAGLSVILRASFPLSGGAAMERCDQQSQEGFSWLPVSVMLWKKRAFWKAEYFVVWRNCQCTAPRQRFGQICWRLCRQHRIFPRRFLARGELLNGPSVSGPSFALKSRANSL